MPLKFTNQTKKKKNHNLQTKERLKITTHYSCRLPPQTSLQETNSSRTRGNPGPKSETTYDSKSLGAMDLLLTPHKKDGKKEMHLTKGRWYAYVLSEVEIRKRFF